MGIDWNAKDASARLLAAMVAAQDLKLNYSKIAEIFGQGATYNAIEGHFRKIRKEAVQLLEEQPSGVAPVPKTPRKARVPKKGKAEAGLVVLGGRVKKPSAPAKRGKAIKKEDASVPGPAEIDADVGLMGSQTEVPFSFSFSRAEDMWLSSEDSFSQSFGI
ncbi:hypothetical protein MMC29_004295 [Sticta canariensis]|nr:hypothetical protein [Sticta canariensis]